MITGPNSARPDAAVRAARPVACGWSRRTQIAGKNGLPPTCLTVLWHASSLKIDAILCLTLSRPNAARRAFAAGRWCRRLSLSACWFAGAAPATAQTEVQVPRRIEAFLQACETSRKGAIAQLEYRTARAACRRVARRLPRARRIKTVEANLRYLHAQQGTRRAGAPFSARNWRHWPFAAAHVPRRTRSSPKIEMLVQCNFSLKVRTVRNFQPRLETVVRPVTFLIDGLPTYPKSREGADAPLLDVFEITADAPLPLGLRQDQSACWSSRRST